MRLLATHPFTAQQLLQRLRGDFADFAGQHVARTDRTEGLKLIFDDRSWLLMRPSGTEPIVRIYSEAASIKESEQLAEDARKWIYS